ncbi:hypothetical protein K469DRAFT_715478 [Zopfia rhizophila CBS 207.26]|uniref:Uncharacterized protein n=1 Tax=Zopfia rhizophila CBS 207.26 TaxID=1314779 RepID=A0A6A6DP92_9PEZI|nr:hypothetical protein K469DRAFT_715478 [Zopfia rhizophila CBS 207.26]
MVEYRPRVSSHTVSRVINLDAWLYVRTFFDAVEASDSLLLSALSFNNIGLLVQENNAVFDAVVAVGAIYAHQNLFNLGRDAAQRGDVHKLCLTFRQQIAAELCEPPDLRDPTFLLRLLLLGFIELMTDKTGLSWGQLVHHFWHYVILNQYTSPMSKNLNSQLLQLTRMSIVIRELMFLVTPPAVEPTLEGSLASLCDTQRIIGPGLEPVSSENEMLEFLIRTLGRWACLKNRTINWMKDIYSLWERDRSLRDRCSARESLEGLEIISQACTLQQEVITMISSYTATSAPPLSASRSGNFMLPMLHWILAGISRIFSTPAWQSQDWELPVMQESLIHDQALKALDGAEKMMNRAQLEAVFYGTMSPVVGLEMELEEERERVIRLLRNIERKGFAVAEALEMDIRMGWRDPDAIFFGAHVLPS